MSLWSCRNDKNSISLPLSTITSNVDVADSFSVSLSTVLIDSIPTSFTNQMLVGSYSDPEVGKVMASSYFQISLNNHYVNGDGTEAILLSPNEPIYDYLEIILKNNYTYGDTNDAFIINVHEVTDVINMRGLPNLYNSTYFKFDPAILGSDTLYTPPYDDTLRIRLNDKLGRDIFTKAKAFDLLVANNINFKEYLRGLVLTPGENNNCMFGFSVSSSLPVMRLHYHDAVTLTNYSYDFVLKNSDIYYNRITNDRKSTQLIYLKQIYQELSAENTNNNAYLLTGIDLFPKINFPYLGVLKSTFSNGILINKAELLIYPDPAMVNSTFTLPKSLFLYTTDKFNIPISYIYKPGSSTSVQIVSPLIDDNVTSNSRYTFDITSFISTKLSSPAYENLALYLAPSAGARVEKLVLKKGHPLTGARIILRIYITYL